MEEVEHVAAAGAADARGLACIGERVQERQILTERMDDLEREPDAGGLRLRNESRVRVAEDARGALPRRTVAPAAQDEQHVGTEPVRDVDGTPHAVHPAPDRPALDPKLSVRADVRDLQLR